MQQVPRKKTSKKQSPWIKISGKQVPGAISISQGENQCTSIKKNKNQHARIFANKKNQHVTISMNKNCFTRRKVNKQV